MKNPKIASQIKRLCVFLFSNSHYGNGAFVVIGSGYVYVSSDNGSGGLNWTRHSIPGGSHISFYGGIYTNPVVPWPGAFIVPFGAGTNLLSYDGINWIPVNTGITRELGEVDYANGLFMARAGSYFATSKNGRDWFQYPEPLPGTNLRGYCVASDGKRLVTVGGKYVSSPNNYDGFVYTSGVLVGVQMTNVPAMGIELSGLVGRYYQIQSTDVLNGNSGNWITNTTLYLTNSPYLWADDVATNSQRFYRGVLLP